MAVPTVKLLSGCQMPLLGLGTFKIKGYENVFKTLEAALASGYRSFDTASVYRNETDIGRAFKILLPKFSLQRQDIFITSKLGPAQQGKTNASQALLKSLQHLDCEYLDLYLIHWPGAHKLKPADKMHQKLRAESWVEMEEAFRQGKVKSIGISNYLPSHIEELLSVCTVKPSVLQIEYHPHLIQTTVKSLCETHAIHLQAYSSLGTSSAENKLIKDPKVMEISQQVQKSPAQVLLRWAVQQQIGVLPKSTNPSHIAENIDVFSFSLSEDQMAQLSGLDQQTHYCWDPQQVR
ncbi:alcohol dehydrogenase [NADP(+)] [Plakobranchus ocellatus]|uniref:Alcohol dehydrogenase [NADP(+)] n=1 Tax=Plakobranchus ocellatus TaxID=259542 RepID=A0AAV3YK24_9GAST|nr:alcohol dehydrogenase [NADP(+)] [Plakobranchus ocellatus]